nr:O-antigen ligase family protein [Microbacterium amylolyticum]
MHGTAAQALVDLLRSPTFARAYTLTALAAAFGTTAIHHANGPVTLATIVAGLAAIGIAILVLRRDELSVIGFAPTSLVLYASWALASVAWALDGAKGRTLTAWIALAGWAVIAITIAHVRDTLQIVRGVGDVLRWLLTASLALEVLSGIVLDVPFAFLRITGDIAYGGPVQGLFGSRNLLGFVAVLALITFIIEWRARAIPRHVAVYSITLAALLLILARSPGAFVVVTITLLAVVALASVRRLPRARRPRAHATLAAITIVLLVIVYAARHTIISMFAATTGFQARADLWFVMLEWVRHKPIWGWSWFGSWEGGPFPTNIIDITIGVPHHQGLNAYLDVLLQLGWVGLVLFVILALVALTRAWLAATDRRSVVYAWLPLVLIALLVESAFESYALTDLGWMLLVVCAVRAGQERSWRTRIDPAAPIPPPPRRLP